MKIVFVANDAVLYGSSKSMINLIEEFRKLYDYEFYVIIPKKGVLEKELQKRGINYKIFRYYSWIYPEKENKQLKYFIKRILTSLSIIPMAMWLKKNKIDIVHSNTSATYIGMLSAKFAKVKHVWHIREFVEEDHHNKFLNKTKTIKTFNESDGIIYISKAVQNKYKDLVTKPKSYLVYNGIPVEEYRNDLIPSVDRDFKLIIIGNISGTKGHKDAICAVQELLNRGIKNVKLLIAGDGVCRTEYETYVKENNLENNVEFLGFINNLSDVRKQTNIALVCSKNEAFGRVTVEAMSAKNLVIGSNTAGTLELVQDKETGFLYQEGDYIDLANKIEYAINNWQECEKIIEVASKYAIDNFNISICAKNINKVYEELMREN